MKYLATLILLSGLANLAWADDAAEFKYRQGVMRAVGGHMVAISTILRQGVHKQDLVAHTRAMSTLAGLATGVFPEGSNVARSEALPKIWEQPDEFKQAMDRFVKAADQAAAAAQSDDPAAMGLAMRSLGGSCKNCHDNFREDHDH
jgi:cytochrome c556